MADLLRHIGFLLLVLTILCCGTGAAQTRQAPSRAPQWEVVAVTEPAASASPASAPEISVEVHDGGVVLITTDRPASIKVYSILGQLITQKQVGAGTVRLRMDARGIYILKAGDITRRINL